MATQVCPFCGTENRAEARHCRQCGRPLLQEAPPPPPVAAATCPACGASLSPGARFCPRCGTAVTGEAPRPAIPPALAVPPSLPPTPPAYGAAAEPAPTQPSKKRFPVLPVALGVGALLLCLCVVGVIVVTQFKDQLPWVTQPTETPIVVTEPPSATPEPRPTDTPTPEVVRRVERWALRERGGASPGLLFVRPDCPTCDVRADVFRPRLSTIELGGDRLYYWDELLEKAFYVTPDNAVHEIPAPAGALPDFEVAPDASQIAWSVSDTDDAGVTTRIVLSDGEGEGARVVTEKRFTHEEGPRNLIPFAWSPDLRTLYVAQRYWGIGGYILFDILPEPLTLDVATGELRSLNITECSLVALSPDGNTLAYLVEADDHHDLVLRDLRTGNEQRVAGTPGYHQAGDLLFSPDSRYLAYAEALGTPESEAFSLRRVEVASGAVVTLIADERTDEFDVAGWVGNEAGGFDIVIVGPQGSERVSDGGRTLISEHTFVGSWIEEP